MLSEDLTNMVGWLEGRRLSDDTLKLSAREVDNLLASLTSMLITATALEGNVIPRSYRRSIPTAGNVISKDFIGAQK